MNGKENDRYHMEKWETINMDNLREQRSRVVLMTIKIEEMGSGRSYAQNRQHMDKVEPRRNRKRKRIEKRQK